MYLPGASSTSRETQVKKNVLNQPAKHSTATFACISVLRKILLFIFVICGAAAYITYHRDQDQHRRENYYTVHQVFEPARYVICIAQVQVKKFQRNTSKTTPLANEKSDFNTLQQPMPKSEKWYHYKVKYIKIKKNIYNLIYKIFVINAYVKH